MQFFFAKDRFFEYKADAVKHGGAKNVVKIDLRSREDAVPFLNALIIPVGTESPSSPSEAYPDVPFEAFEPDPEIAAVVPEFMRRDWEQRIKYARARRERDQHKEKSNDEDL